MLQSTETPLVEAFDLAIVDLDGVTYRGPQPVAHAPESLTAARAAGMPLLFVTNNASREPESVAAQLRGLGIDTEPDEVMTAAQAAASHLVDLISPGDPVLVVGGPGLVSAVQAAGFDVVTSAADGPKAVVQGFSPDISWRQLAEASYAVRAGARHLASNLDLTLPNDRGIAPGNGALVAAVVAATGMEPDSVGKPEPTMFHLAAQRRGARRPLVVGDRLDTDIAGACAAGYPALQVFTGVSSPRQVVLAEPGQRPTFLGADLRSLHQRHPGPQRDAAGWWRCGEAAARVVAGRLELRPQSGIDAVRAACAAVWTAGAEGVDVDPTSVPELGLD